MTVASGFGKFTRYRICSVKKDGSYGEWSETGNLEKNEISMGFTADENGLVSFDLENSAGASDMLNRLRADGGLNTYIIFTDENGNEYVCDNYTRKR